MCVVLYFRVCMRLYVVLVLFLFLDLVWIYFWSVRFDFDFDFFFFFYLVHQFRHCMCVGWVYDVCVRWRWGGR